MLKYLERDSETEAQQDEAKVDLNNKFKIEQKGSFKWVVKDLDRFDRHSFYFYINIEMRPISIFNIFHMETRTKSILEKKCLSRCPTQITLLSF